VKVLTGLVFLLTAAPAASQQAPGSATASAPEVRQVEFAFNFLDVAGDRPGRFFQGQRPPDGFLMPSVRWDLAGRGLSTYLQVDAQRAFQPDEQWFARFGKGSWFEGRLSWGRVPWVSGNAARSLLTSGTVQAQSSTLQRLLQDPNRDGILGSDADNALTPAVVRDLLTAATPSTLGVDRRTGELSLSFAPSTGWSIDVAYRDEVRSGTRAMGSGTYDRLTFTPAPESGGVLDEFFFLRGTELVRPIDFSTRRFHVGTSVTRSRGFANAGVEWTRFGNGTTALTYSNPLWSTDTSPSPSCPPGIFRNWCRGLWNQGRYALEPDNDGVYVDVGGGLTLTKATRLTVTLVRGTVTQNEPFLPYTTNTALNGRVDLNQDGIVDARDAGTDVATLPRSSLDGEATTTTFTFTLGFSTRPMRVLQVNVRVPYFDYDRKAGITSFPFRAEYVESTWNTGIQGVRPVLTEDTSHSSRGVVAEGLVRPTSSLNVKVFGDVRRREYAEREVTSTDTRTIGAGVGLTPTGPLDLRLTYARANREFDGTYQPKYAGEQQGLRMFDVARMTRDSLLGDVSVDLARQATIGVNLRYLSDDYPASEFGLRRTRTKGVGVDASIHAVERALISAYYDYETYRFDGRGDTKMGTFSRQGNDWFYRIADRTQSIGAGIELGIVPDTYAVEVDGYLVDGNVASSNRNGTGPRYSPLAAEAVDFPDQESRVAGARLRVTRRLGARYSVGLSYWYEDYRLNDFAWANLQPYGPDFLAVDESLRMLFLDSRYGNYAASIGQLFVRVIF
jgi:hypothetical protein